MTWQPISGTKTHDCSCHPPIMPSGDSASHSAHTTALPQLQRSGAEDQLARGTCGLQRNCTRTGSVWSLDQTVKARAPPAAVLRALGGRQPGHERTKTHDWHHAAPETAPRTPPPPGLRILRPSALTSPRRTITGPTPRPLRPVSCPQALRKGTLRFAARCTQPSRSPSQRSVMCSWGQKESAPNDLVAQN